MSEPYFWSSRNAWYLNYTQDGQRKKKCLGRTKAEAYRKWKDWLAASDQQRRGDVRFEALAAQWLMRQVDRAKRAEVSPEWLKRAARTVSTFNSAHPGILCKAITPTVACGWLPKESSSAYEYTEVGILRQIMKWGLDHGQIPMNPLAGMRLARGARRAGCVDPTTHKTLVRAAAGVEFKRLLWFCWWTGCRPIELRHLCWEQLSDDCSMATMAKHKTAKKTGRPRVIYFVPEAQRVLTLMRRDSGYVFLNSRGVPWTKNAIVQRMRRLREATGLELTAYAYRHGYATRALEQGVPVADVAELLGTSIEVISRNYSHLDERRERLKEMAIKAQRPR